MPGLAFAVSIPAFPVKESLRAASSENCPPTDARNIILIAYICKYKSFLSIP